MVCNTNNILLALRHNARLFDIYDARSPFLGEVHAIPPSCFVPSSVYRRGDHCAMPPVSPAIIHLADVALVISCTPAFPFVLVHARSFPHAHELMSACKQITVKVQFKGLELFKKKGALVPEKYYRCVMGFRGSSVFEGSISGAFSPT